MKKKFARLSSHIDAFDRVISQDQEKSDQYSLFLAETPPLFD